MPACRSQGLRFPGKGPAGLLRGAVPGGSTQRRGGVAGEWGLPELSRPPAGSTCSPGTETLKGQAGRQGQSFRSDEPLDSGEELLKWKIAQGYEVPGTQSGLTSMLALAVRGSEGPLMRPEPSRSLLHQLVRRS